ncbi:MAG: ATP-binding cassette domain-containing protein [Bacteroidales bacterium]|nr:ATP-binding cassette domain-containing protein [Bacteroidales bacterium]
MNKHYAIESTDISMKGTYIQSLLKGSSADIFPELKDKKGMLFSNITLSELVKEEYEHEKMTLSTLAGRNVLTLSSGEQMKLLFNYIVSLNPDFIILDNPFDCLDIASVKELNEKLLSLSDMVCFIQIFKRKADLLSCITHVIEIADNSLSAVQTISDYLSKKIDTENTTINKIPLGIFSDYTLPEVLIEMKSVSVSFNEKKVLRDVCWTVKRGEFWQLVGPNGSGKTTLLSMIYGNNSKAYGQDIFLFGRKKGTGESVWEIKDKIGYFTPSLTDLFSRNNTLWQMVVSGLYDSVGLYKKTTYLEKKMADEWLKVIGLFAEKDVSFHDITQVKQRMVLLARAMIKHPPLLILDEPSTGLNDKNAALLSLLINKIADQTETAIIYVSHRKEPELQPKHILELQISVEGSTGCTLNVEN